MSLLNRKPALLLLIVLLVYSLLYLVWVAPLQAIQVVDYWGHMDVAEKLSLRHLETLYHQFYPAGYFVLLRLGLASGVDMARFGQFLSWAGSVLLIAAVFGLLYRFTRNRLYVLLGVALLLVHPVFRFHAMREGTDMLAAGLALASLYFLIASDKTGRNKTTLIVAGLLLGLAYLIRYTSAVLFPIALVYLVLNARRISRETVLTMAVFTLSFAIVIAPQVLVSLQATGAPFANSLAKNVWFGMYGDFNFTDNWGKIPNGITLAQIVRDDPAGFFGHLASEFGRFFLYEPVDGADQLGIIRNVTLWNPLLLHLFWLASCVLLLFDRRLNFSDKALLLMALFIPILAASMAWLYTRFLLLALGLQVVILILAITQAGDRLLSPRYRPYVLAGFTLGLIGLFVVTTGWSAAEQRVREMTQRVAKMNTTLSAAGAQAINDVISNNLLYQTLDGPGHERYEHFRSYNNDTSLTLSEMLERIIGDRDGRFLIFDWSTHAIRTYDYDSYRSEMLRDKQLLVPLQITDEVTLLCRYPCRLTPPDDEPISLGSDLELLGHEAYLGDDGTMSGIYLFWRATSAIDRNYVIRLEILDAAGQLLASNTGAPQLGTYPTSSWPVGQRIVDYHQLPGAAIEPGHEYRLRITLEDEGGRPTGIPSLELPATFSQPILEGA